MGFIRAVIDAIAGFFYSPDDSQALQQKVDADNSAVDYSEGENSCDSSVHSCPYKDQPLLDNPLCQFTGIAATKEGRKFDYEWQKGSGTIVDGNFEDSNIYEIIAGDEKDATITIEKSDLAGPCNEFPHSGFSWDVEGKYDLPDDKFDLKVLAPVTQNTDLDHYLPFDISPRKYPVGAATCGAIHYFTVQTYPDTQLTLDGSFTFFEGKRNRKYNTSGESSGKSGELNLALKRNGKESFKINLLSYEDKEETKSFETDADYGKEKALDRRIDTVLESESKNPTAYLNKDAIAGVKKFKAARELRRKINKFFDLLDGVFGNFQESAGNKKPLSIEVTFLKVSANVSTKWIEVPSSRHCDFQISGKISCSPIFSIKIDYDFTSVASKIPYLGPVIAVTDAFLEAFELGDLGIKFIVTGNIGVSTDEFKFKLRGIKDPSQKESHPGVNLKGEVGVTLRAYATGKYEKTSDFWDIKCGGEAHAEAGIRAKFADTETILSEVAETMKEKMSKSEKEAFDKKFESSESKQSRLYYYSGKLIMNAKIGFSGLVVYTLTYAKLSCSRTTSNSEVPEDFIQADSTVVTTKQESSRGGGFTKQVGDEEEKVQAVWLADPLIWEPEINFFGND